MVLWDISESFAMPILLFCGAGIPITSGMIRLTRTFLKCKKCYKEQNFTYHYVEVSKISGSRSGNFRAYFAFNGKTFSLPTENHKVKYFHVFDCDGEIMFTLDNENLLK